MPNVEQSAAPQSKIGYWSKTVGTGGITPLDVRSVASPSTVAPSWADAEPKLAGLDGPTISMSSTDPAPKVTAPR